MPDLMPGRWSSRRRFCGHRLPDRVACAMLLPVK